MQTVKQVHSRLLNKKNSLNRVNHIILDAEKNRNSVLLRRLNQEKGTLSRDIEKLERQLIEKKRPLNNR